jgi:hypothetical protein
VLDIILDDIMPDQFTKPQENNNKDRLIILHIVITAAI